MFNFLATFLRKVETCCALLQGKGWGSVTIQHEVKSTLSFIPTPTTVIDVGANKGDWTAAMRTYAPHANIFAFEPDPSNVAALRRRFKNDSHVTIVPHALAAQSGKSKLYTNENGSVLASLLPRDLDHFNLSLNQTIPISTINMTDFLKAYPQVKKIDVLKLDVEGLEHAILSSIPNHILKKIKIVQFEFGGTCLDARVFFKDFWDLFHKAFTLYRMSPLGNLKVTSYTERLEQFVTTNYLAVNHTLCKTKKD